MTLLIFIIATLSFAIAAFTIRKRRTIVQKRIEKFISRDIGAEAIKGKQRKVLVKSPFRFLIETASRYMKTTDKRSDKLAQLLLSAGIPLKPEEFMAIRAGLFGLLIFIGWLAGSHLLLVMFLGTLGLFGPSLYIKKKRELRISLFAEQLPQTLEIMANAMKSGFSFMQAMQLAANEMPNPIQVEYRQTIKEINLGISMEQAFQNLLKRLPNKDLEIVITAVLIQRTTGGNLAGILETIHETIAERVQMKDELKALTAQGRMSALVITLLPVIIGGMLSILNPGYFEPMLGHPLGWLMLGGGCLSGLLGWIFIKKVVTIEV